jgi:uncharacterized protein YqeY
MIKEQIQKDLVKAFKEHNTTAKIAIGELKAAILEAEKAGKGIELGDQEIVKIVTKLVNNHKASAEFCVANGRQDIADKDIAEMNVLREYLPAQMPTDAIRVIVKELYEKFSNMPNEQARKGKTIGEFNKLYNGQADVAEVKKLVEEL